MLKGQFFIKGMALHGQVKGWITELALEELNKSFSDNLRLLHKRKKIVDNLIQNQQIALGMNSTEVIASMGKPDKKIQNWIVMVGPIFLNTQPLNVSHNTDCVETDWVIISSKNIMLKWKRVNYPLNSIMTSLKALRKLKAIL